MGLIPGVTIVLEGTETVLMRCPGFHSIPPLGSFLHLSFDGGPETEYKIERVDTYLQSSTHLNPSGGTTHKSVAGTSTITVSPVL